MGNSLCQRVLSLNESSIHLIWEQEYNEMMGAKLLLSNRLKSQLIEKLNATHINQPMKKKALSKLAKKVTLPSHSDKKDYSGIIKQLFDARAQVTPKLLKEYILKQNGPLSQSDSLKADEGVEGQVGENIVQIKNILGSKILNPVPLACMKTQDMLYYPAESRTNSVLSQERFNLCMTLHVMTNNLKESFEEKFGAGKMGDKEENKSLTIEEANLQLVLEAYKAENSDDQTTKLMIITFKIFLANFQAAIAKGNFSKILSHMDQAFELISCLNSESDLGKQGNQQDYETDDYFRQLTFNMISLIKAGKVLDTESEKESSFSTEQLQNLFTACLKMTFLLKQVSLHLLLIDAYKSTLIEKAIIVEDLPVKLQTWCLDTLPTIVTTDSKLKRIEDMSSNFKKFKNQENKPVTVIGHEDSIIISERDTCYTAFLGNQPEIDTLKVTHYSENDGDLKTYMHNGSIHAMKSDMIGPVDLANGKVSRKIYMDYYCSLRSDCGPWVKKFRSDGSFDNKDRTFVFDENSNYLHSYSVRLMKNSNYDETLKAMRYRAPRNIYDFIPEEKNDLTEFNKLDSVETNAYEFVLTILEHTLRRGNTWSSCGKDTMILKDGLPYGGWVDDGSNFMRVDFIGGNSVLGVTSENFTGDKTAYNENTGRYLVCRNKKSVVVIDPKNFTVISEHYFEDEKTYLTDYEMPWDPKTSEKYKDLSDENPVKFDSCKLHVVSGFDIQKNLAYRFYFDKEDPMLQISEVEMVCLFNRALQVRKLLKFAGGTKEEQKLKKAIEVLELQEVPQNLEVDSDTDDSEYMDIFQSKNSQSTAASSGKNQKVTALHKLANREFYLRYLDWLMRMLYVGNPDIKKLISSDSDQKKKILNDENRIELNESFFKILIHFLKKYRKSDSENDACFLMYLVKAVEKHLDYLIEVQKPVLNLKQYKKKSVVIKPSTLKKLNDILKKIENDQVPDLSCSIYYYRQSIRKSSANLFKLLGKHRHISIPERIRMILAGDVLYSYDECFEILGLLIPQRLQDLLKTRKLKEDEENLDPNSIEQLTLEIGESLKEVEQEIIDAFSSVFELETSTFESILIKNQKKENWPLCKDPKNSLLQKNLSNFLNAFIAFMLKQKIKNQNLFSQILAKFFEKALESLVTLQGKIPDVRKNYKFKPQSHYKSRFIRIFDDFFKNSIVGNLVTITFSFNDFFPPYFKSQGMEGEVKQLLIEFIKFVNVFGDSLSSYAVRSTEEEKKKEITEHEITVPKNLNLENGQRNLFKITEMDPKSMLAVVKVNKIAQYDANYFENGSFELFGKFNYASKHKLEETWFDNSRYIFMSLPSSSKIKIEQRPDCLKWRSHLNFVNLGKLSLNYLSQSIQGKVEIPKNPSNIRTGFSVEEVKIWQKASKSDKEKLNSIFGSEVFEMGLDRAEVDKMNGKSLQGILSDEDLSEIDLVKRLNGHIIGLAGLSQFKVQFDSFCDELQKRIKKKDMFSSLGGEMGMNCAQSFFIVTLKHNGNLDELISDFEINNAEVGDLYVKQWHLCSKIRKIVRTFNNKMEFIQIFEKMRVLFSLTPSEKYMVYPPLPGMGMGKNELALSPQKMALSPSKSRNPKNSTQRIKNYLQSLRTGKAEEEIEENRSKSTSHKLVELLLGFATTTMKASDILTLIEYRRFQFEIFRQKIDLFEQLTHHQQGSILSYQILVAFCQLFRVQSSNLSPLSPDFRGLPLSLRQSLLKDQGSILNIFVDIFCKTQMPEDPKSEEYKQVCKTKLMCLDALKWRYRGREAEVVQNIDIWRMWKANFGGSGNYEQDIEPEENSLEIRENTEEGDVEPQSPSKKKRKKKVKDLDPDQFQNIILNSFLELVQILMGYCVRKIGDLSGESEENQVDLSLRRSHSTVDEDSMASILVKILQLLVGELENTRKRLDLAEPVNALDLLNYNKYQDMLDNSVNSLVGYWCQQKDSGQIGDSRKENKIEFDYLKKQDIPESEIQRRKIEELINFAINPTKTFNGKSGEVKSGIEKKIPMPKIPPPPVNGEDIGALFGNSEASEPEENQEEEEEEEEEEAIPVSIDTPQRSPQPEIAEANPSENNSADGEGIGMQNLFATPDYSVKSKSLIAPQEESAEKAESCDSVIIDENSDWNFDLSPLEKPPKKNFTKSKNYENVFNTLYQLFDDFTKPEKKDEPNEELNSEKKKTPLKIVFAEKHIQKITHILNILYSAVVQLPRSTIDCIFSPGFINGKLNTNLQTILSIICGNYPLTHQNVAINILLELLGSKASFSDQTFEIIAKQLCTSLQKNQSVQNLNQQKVRIKFANQLILEDQELGNLVLKKLNSGKSGYLIIQILTFSAVNSKLRKSAGSIVSVKENHSSTSLISCNNLLLLDKNYLDLYVPPSINYSQKRKLNQEKYKATDLIFNDGLVPVYHQIPALNLNSGELTLVKEQDIITWVDLPPSSQEKIALKLKEYNVENLIENLENSQERIQSRGCFSALLNQIGDSSYEICSQNLFEDPTGVFLEGEDEEIQFLENSSNLALNIDLEELMDIPSVDKAEYLGFEVVEGEESRFEEFENRHIAQYLRFEDFENCPENGQKCQNSPKDFLHLDTGMDVLEARTAVDEGLKLTVNDLVRNVTTIDSDLKNEILSNFIETQFKKYTLSKNQKITNLQKLVQLAQTLQQTDSPTDQAKLETRILTCIDSELDQLPTDEEKEAKIWEMCDSLHQKIYALIQSYGALGKVDGSILEALIFVFILCCKKIRNPKFFQKFAGQNLNISIEFILGLESQGRISLQECGLAKCLVYLLKSTIDMVTMLQRLKKPLKLKKHEISNLVKILHYQDTALQIYEKNCVEVNHVDFKGIIGHFLFKISCESTLSSSLKNKKNSVEEKVEQKVEEKVEEKVGEKVEEKVGEKVAEKSKNQAENQAEKVEEKSKNSAENQAVEKNDPFETDILDIMGKIVMESKGHSEIEKYEKLGKINSLRTLKYFHKLIRENPESNKDELYCLFQLNHKHSEKLEVKKSIVQYYPNSVEIDLGNKFTNWVVKSSDHGSAFVISRDAAFTQGIQKASGFRPSIFSEYCTTKNSLTPVLPSGENSNKVYLKYGVIQNQYTTWNNAHISNRMSDIIHAEHDPKSPYFHGFYSTAGEPKSVVVNGNLYNCESRDVTPHLITSGVRETFQKVSVTDTAVWFDLTNIERVNHEHYVKPPFNNSRVFIKVPTQNIGRVTHIAGVDCEGTFKCRLDRNSGSNPNYILGLAERDIPGEKEPRKGLIYVNHSWKRENNSFVTGNTQVNDAGFGSLDLEKNPEGIFKWLFKKQQTQSRSRCKTHFSHEKGKVVYAELEQDITHYLICKGTNIHCLVIRDRISKDQVLVKIKDGELQERVYLGKERVNALLGEPNGAEMYLLFENGKLWKSMQNLSKALVEAFNTVDKLIQIDKFVKIGTKKILSGFARLKFLEYPDNVKVVQAGVSENSLVLKFKFWTVSEAEVKYAFNVYGTNKSMDITSNQATMKSILRYIEAGENSKLTSFNAQDKQIFATGLEGDKVVCLVANNGDNDMRSKFENGHLLRYPFFVWYDPEEDQLLADNFENLAGKNPGKDFSDDKYQWDIVRKIKKFRHRRNFRKLDSVVEKIKKIAEEEKKLKDTENENLKKLNENLEVGAITKKFNEKLKPIIDEIEDSGEKIIVKTAMMCKTAQFLSEKLKAKKAEIDEKQAKKKELLENRQKLLASESKLDDGELAVIISRPSSKSGFLKDKCLEFLKKCQNKKTEDFKEEDCYKFKPKDIVIPLHDSINFDSLKQNSKFDFSSQRPSNYLFNHEDSVKYPALVYLHGPIHPRFKGACEIFRSNIIAHSGNFTQKKSEITFYPDFLKINEREMTHLKEVFKLDGSDWISKDFTKYLNFLVNDSNTKTQNSSKFADIFMKEITSSWKGTGREAAGIDCSKMNTIGRMNMMLNFMAKVVMNLCPKIQKSLLPPKLGTLDWFSGFTMTDKEKEKILLSEQKNDEKSKNYGLVTSEPLHSQNIEVNRRVVVGLAHNVDYYHLFHEEKEVLAQMKNYFMSDYFNLSRFKWNSSSSFEVPVDRYMADKAYRDDQSMSYLNQNSDYFHSNNNNQLFRYRYLRRIEYSFKGEPGVDDSGLKREWLNFTTNQVLDPSYGLFIPSPNQKHNLGQERDKYVPNPKSTSDSDMRNYFQLGIGLALVFKLGDILGINFPSIFWKYLLNHPLEWDDIKYVSHNIHFCTEKIEKMESEHLDYIDETFVTFLFDGTEVELKPGGKGIKLTKENRAEYLNLVKQVTFAQLYPAYQKIKEGFYTFFRQGDLVNVTPEQLETDISGMNYVDINHLKKITQYSGDNGQRDQHPAVQRFWRVLESFDQKQLSLYLKFVCGRSRLSHGFSDYHKLTLQPGRNYIPEAHTCYFELDLGTGYENDEDLRKKLLYGIQNCNEIAESGSAYRLDAGFGMQWR